MNKNLKEIWLAGGCFWGLEAYMAKIFGVKYVTVGYANGKTVNPTYEDVCYRNTGFAETVHVLYDADMVSLETLLYFFFQAIDPTSINKQGNDIGSQYRSGIYYKDLNDLSIIKNIIANEQKNYPKQIVTEVTDLKNYYLAEDYHQKYLEKNPNGYCHIDLSKIEDISNIKVAPKLYHKTDETTVKSKLTPEQDIDK